MRAGSGAHNVHFPLFPVVRCEPTILPEVVHSVPDVLLQSVYKSNISRFGRFVSEQYILDPAADPRTAKICLVIRLLEERLNKLNA